MPLPKISVITPSFNQALFLEENIQSVLSQHYPHVEHIIIDGGSTDGTLDILRGHPSIRYISEKDRGQSHALNKGFRMATGEIIGWINSDDGYRADIFHEVADRFQSPGVNVVYGQGIIVDAQGSAIRTVTPRGITSDDFIRYWRWKYDYVQSAFFFRRSVFDKIGYIDESLYYAMDHEFFIRLLLNYTFVYLQKPLAYFRLHDVSKTGKAIQTIIPKDVWTLHTISKRYWGKPTKLAYYGYLLSFAAAIGFSFLKNIAFVPGSKSREFLRRRLLKSESLVNGGGGSGERC
jgi:glycosyltransferase involved in cell wall biosynthesis